MGTVWTQRIAMGWLNVPDTSNRERCPCGSWKNHWIRHSGDTWPDECSVLGCGKEATDGAHVKHDIIQGEQIVPMCPECNSIPPEESINLDLLVKYVSAQSMPTCGTDE